MRTSLPANLIIPDYGAEYIHWRFLTHPHRQYRFIQIRSQWGRVIGLAIFTPIQEMQTEMLALLCHSQDIEYCMGEILKHHQAHCYAWLSAAAAAYFPAGQDTDIQVPVPTIRQNELAGIKPETQRDCWWLTGADTDFK